MRSDPYHWEGMAEFTLASMWLRDVPVPVIAERFGVDLTVIWSKAHKINLPPRRPCWDGNADRRPQ